MGDVEGEQLIGAGSGILDGADDFQYVPGAEIGLLQSVHGELNLRILEGERDGLAGNEGELVRPVQKAYIDAAAVRTVVMDDLVVGVGDLGVVHQVLEDVAVLDLADSEDRVIDLVVILHGTDHPGHVVDLLPVFAFGPLVGAVRQVLVVVLPLVVVGVEEVLEVVEPYHVGTLRLLGHDGRRQEGSGQEYA